MIREVLRCNPDAFRDGDIGIEGRDGGTWVEGGGGGAGSNEGGLFGGGGTVGGGVYSSSASCLFRGCREKCSCVCRAMRKTRALQGMMKLALLYLSRRCGRLLADGSKESWLAGLPSASFRHSSKRYFEPVSSQPTLLCNDLPARTQKKDTT